jgi:beta-ureidopropionase
MSRYVTVASVSHMPSPNFRGNYDGLLDFAAHHIWRAKMMKAQIVAFPEIYCQFIADNAVEAAEALDGPSITRMQKEARKNKLHVIWPIYTRQEGTIYNSAVLIGPDGAILGDYHKMHPTVGEIEAGCLPGTEATVVETDFGKVGMCICFDINFPDVLHGLKDNGAEVIFFCSAFKGGRIVSYWGFQLGCYMVSAVASELGQVVDQGGRQLALSTYESLIACPINLNSRLLHMDYNWDKMDAMYQKYGSAVSFEYYTPEAVYRVASERKGLEVADLVAEFGLEERADYWVRANKVRDAALRKAKR